MEKNKTKSKTKKIVTAAVIAALVVLIACLAMYFCGVFDNWGTDEKAALITGDGYTITAKIDGKYITSDDMDPWIIKRIRKVEKNLDLAPLEETNAEDMLVQLADAKTEMGYDAICEKLNKKLDSCESITEFMVDLSGGKTQYCITELEVEGLDLQTFLDAYNKLSTENTENNLKVNLSVAPDHYYLGMTDDGTFEVIETCGSNPLPSQFFIDYSDVSSLNSQRDEQTYSEESAGVAMTSTGIVEGGVRHQFRETENGFVAVLLVEFPTSVPKTYVKNHQMHLACEFSHWAAWIAENAQ